MTLENCKRLLENAKARGDAENVAALEAKIERKSRMPKYAPKVEAKPETKPNKGK